MKILGIETSSNVASVAYVNDDVLVSEITLNNKLTHSQTLMPMLDQMCGLCGLELEEVDAIAIASGPGSFTGLRIGAATVKGLALGLDKPIIPVPTLDAMAYNIAHSASIICPIMDARRQQVYTAIYRMEDGKLVKETEDLNISIDELIQELKNWEDTEIIFVGDGIPVHMDKLKEELDHIAFADSHLNRQRGSAVAALGKVYYKKGIVEDHRHFAPTYVRVAQAQREYEERTNKRI